MSPPQKRGILNHRGSEGLDLVAKSSYRAVFDHLQREFQFASGLLIGRETIFEYFEELVTITLHIFLATNQGGLPPGTSAQMTRECYLGSDKRRVCAVNRVPRQPGFR